MCKAKLEFVLGREVVEQFLTQVINENFPEMLPCPSCLVEGASVLRDKGF